MRELIEGEGNLDGGTNHRSSAEPPDRPDSPGLAWIKFTVARGVIK
jgi:hypothetical protein